MLLTACLIATAGQRAEGFQAELLDPMDISWLWPAPRQPQDVAALISGSDLLSDQVTTIWPQQAFQDVIDAAQGMQVSAEMAGSEIGITFRSERAAFEQLSTWHLAAVRIDPSAPGTSDAVIAHFGEHPQVRLTFQPVAVDGASVRIHDVTAHVVYEISRPPNATEASERNSARIADFEAFSRLVSDLLDLKRQFAAEGFQTNGPMSVHPAAESATGQFTERVRAVLLRHLTADQLKAVAFMGTRRPEPWIFFAMTRTPAGSMQFVRHPSLGGSIAQEFFQLRSTQPVAPVPVNLTFGPEHGVSSAQFLAAAREDRLFQSVFPNEQDSTLSQVRYADIPEILANPRIAHFFNTDCVSCHTDGTMRSQPDVPSNDSEFSWQNVNAEPLVDPEVLPQGRWNVRNFGWGVNLFNGPRQPTITRRTAHETAEGIVFLNRKYLKAAPPAIASTPPKVETGGVAEGSRPQVVSISHPLTLIMTIKSPEDRVALEKLLTDTQGLPPAENPIAVALEKIGTVHFARFVFLDDDRLMIITSFDGGFDDYIMLFTDELGPVFDKILEHIADAPPLPVAEHREKFLDYVRSHDLPTTGGMYSAYPDLSVQDVRQLRSASGDR